MHLHRPTQAHIKDIKILEQSIKDTKIRSNNGEILAECQNVTLRSKYVSELSPANDVSVPRFGGLFHYGADWLKREKI